MEGLLDKHVDVERQWQWRDDMKLHEGSSEGSKFVVRWTLKDTGDAAVPGSLGATATANYSKPGRAYYYGLAKLGRCKLFRGRRQGRYSCSPT